MLTSNKFCKLCNSSKYQINHYILGIKISPVSMRPEWKPCFFWLLWSGNQDSYIWLISLIKYVGHEWQIYLVWWFVTQMKSHLINDSLFISPVNFIFSTNMVRDYLRDKGLFIKNIRFFISLLPEHILEN